jgi:hypothetical protein
METVVTAAHSSLSEKDDRAMDAIYYSRPNHVRVFINLIEELRR